MRYAAFLRGLNVGGRHKVNMAELRQFFADCGFTDVKTIIQSGNVLFSTDESPAALPGMIAAAFASRFGFESPVILRTADELAALAASLPFSAADIARAEAADPAVAHVYYYLSNHPIVSAALDALQRKHPGGDQAVAGTREVFLLCTHSIRLSKLAASLTALDSTFTVRNQKTIARLLATLNAEY